MAYYQCSCGLLFASRTLYDVHKRFCPRRQNGEPDIQPNKQPPKTDPFRPHFLGVPELRIR